MSSPKRILVTLRSSNILVPLECVGELMRALSASVAVEREFGRSYSNLAYYEDGPVGVTIGEKVGDILPNEQAAKAHISNIENPQPEPAQDQGAS